MRVIRKENRERGNGSGGVMFMMIGLSVAIFVFYFVVDWIYYTKENKYPKSMELQRQAMLRAQNVIDRGPGGYTVECSGILKKECR